MNNIYLQWLNSFLITNNEKELMRNYSEKEIEYYFSDDHLKFGTAGIRATMGPGTNQMNKYVYRQLSEGYAKFIKKYNDNPSVLVAHDNRFNSDKFAFECAKVLSSFGIKAILFDKNKLLATPIVSYFVRKYNLSGAIIVTASHNPKNYNGFKVYNSTGAQVTENEAKDIESYFPSNDSILNNVYVLNEDYIGYLNEDLILEYFKDAKKSLVKTNCDEDKDFPIIFTAHHGTASYELPNFLSTLGYSNVISVSEQCFPNSDFINSPSSNPEEKESFDLAMEYAKRTKANIILGVDPDADRLAVVIKDKDGIWNYLTGNEMGILFTDYLLKYKTFTKDKFLVTTYVSTNLVDRIARENNIEVIKTGTGFKWLANAIENNYQTKDFIVAFEEAIGSLNSTINRDKDSFQAAALALEMFHEYSKEGKTFIDVLEKEIYPKYGYWSGKTISFTIKSLEWKEEAQKIVNFFKSYKDNIISEFEFVDNRWNDVANCLEIIYNNDNTLRLRLSGTEPKYKFYINVYGNSIEESHELMHKAEKKIREIIEKI